jgi:molybdenum cofactor cytidylyltransferase
MTRDREKVAGILLAAGASIRMGKTKLLLPINRETLLERVLNEVLKSELDRVILVLGHQAEKIRSVLGQALGHPKLKIIENSEYKKGISSSVIAGLSEAENTYDHVMILLGDIPHTNSKLINLLLHRYLDSRRHIGAIRVKTKRSHPVIFGRKLYHELHKLRGDVGARSLFQKYSGQVCLVQPEDLYDDRDIDTLRDYNDFQRTLKD